MYAVNATETQGGHIACHSLQMMPWRPMNKDKVPEGRGRATGEGGQETCHSPWVEVLTTAIEQEFILLENGVTTVFSSFFPPLKESF